MTVCQQIPQFVQSVKIHHFLTQSIQQSMKILNNYQSGIKIQIDGYGCLQQLMQLDQLCIHLKLLQKKGKLVLNIFKTQFYYLDFKLFQTYRQQNVSTNKVDQFTKQQIYIMLQTFQKKKISDIIFQINQPVKIIHPVQYENFILQKQLPLNEPLYSSKKPPLPPSNQRPYIRLKSVVKESKLSYVIMAMIVQKIHRILIQDIESKMIISILNFKDILLYLLRIANESADVQSYQNVTISSLLQVVKLRNIQIQQHRPLWQAFQAMTDIHRSLWINVVDANGNFKGLLFREDFRDIFKGWHIDYLWMSSGQFIKLKANNHTGNIPQYRFFQPTDITKEIIWKIVMTKGNTIVWVDQQNGHKVKATIGLMQLFSLFVH